MRDVRFIGIEAARPTPEVLAAIDDARVILIAPSNPIVSIGPILALPGMTAALGEARGRGTPVVALSGIVGGRALKGPADRMLASLSREPSALGVARGYAGLIDGFVIDPVDAAHGLAIEGIGMSVLVTDTLMTDDAARARVADEMLLFAEHLR